MDNLLAGIFGAVIGGSVAFSIFACFSAAKKTDEETERIFERERADKDNRSAPEMQGS